MLPNVTTQPQVVAQV